MFTRSLQVLLVFLLLGACKPSSEQKAINLINKSIEAHGGRNIWDQLEAISFLKETNLYHQDSSIENHLVQQIEVRFRPHWEVRMSWENDSILHKAVFDGKKTRYWLGENEIQNTDFLQSKKRDLDAAAYVMTKPFDLLGGSKQVEYLGITRLPEGKEYESVQVIDGNPEDKNADVWIYYFDPTDSRLMGYSVKTLDHTSLVMNLNIKSFGGILFPTERKSYRLTDDGQIAYLRAEYQYTDYAVDQRKND